MRVESVDDRRTLLEAAFRPKAQAILPDGSKSSVDPDVPPPQFIEDLQEMLRNFGNIQSDGFSEKLRALVEEAEAVSLSIYGQSMTVQEQQDMMWKKNTLSVFDLEEWENKAQQTGQMMPWQNDKYDAMTPPGFEPDGSKTIGGGTGSKNQF
jgi:hypothetical protein